MNSFLISQLKSLNIKQNEEDEEWAFDDEDVGPVDLQQQCWLEVEELNIKNGEIFVGIRSLDVSETYLGEEAELMKKLFRLLANEKKIMNN